MRGEAIGKPDIFAREVAIIGFLRRSPEGATVREIHEAVSEALGDNVSRPAYYKILQRLEATGKIESVGNGSQRFAVPNQLHATNRITLDDVYEMLPFVDNTRTMAKAVEAREYLFARRDEVLRTAAEGLLSEDAVEVFHGFIMNKVRALEADLATLEVLKNEGGVANVTGLEQRLQNECARLREVLYRQLSIPKGVVRVPDWLGTRGLRDTGRIEYDEECLRAALRFRVFGVGEQNTFLGFVEVDRGDLNLSRQEMIVSGSDGSFHAGTLNIRTGNRWVEDDSAVVTFNNSVAYVRSSERLEQLKGSKKFLYSAPLTRQTMDDPAYKGMVLAPFMFPTLSPSEYEHMARAASDVVQMRVDDDLFTGKARDIATGEKIIPPRVHLRDGTITPQERGFNHYRIMNPYGDIAREGIERSASILRVIKGARSNPRIYAGAVKSTQIRLFSHLVNWYISRGSRLLRGKAIDPFWDETYGGFVSDVDVMTLLLSTLIRPKDVQSQPGYFASCVVLRQFASLTEFFDTELRDGQSWLDMMREKRQHALEVYESSGGELTYHVLLPEEELENDPYVYMLEHADYASFYIGHTFGNPAPKIPRYEFMCSLRTLDGKDASEHVRRTVHTLCVALLVSGISTDKDHNFLTGLSLAKMVAFVVYQAHELAKYVGKKLEGEFKSMVVARLAERRRVAMSAEDVEIRPVSTREYILRYVRARGALTSSDPEEER